MPARTPGNKSDIAKIVEKQMRNWELARAQRVAELPDEERPAGEQFVAISRMVGSGGSQVAKLLGEKLNWPVFDKEILQAMAGDDALRQRLYESMDERDETWLDNALRWLLRGELRKDDYFYRLNEAILALNRQGPAVFLGRGADLILTHDNGLRVRISGTVERRAAEYAKRHDMSEALARAEVERIDRERGEFIRNHFNKNTNDPTRYDICLNLDRFTPAQGVELILAVMRQRGLGT